VNFHGFALPRDDVPDGFLDILILPQPARAAVARPTLSIPLIDPQTVQVAARVRLESVHDFLGSNVRFHHCVNVIGSHMGCPETPATVQTDLAESIEHCRTAVSVEEIGRLVHLLAFHRDTFGIGFRQPASGHIVVPVDRTGFIAVQMRPIQAKVMKYLLAGVPLPSR
jgi:hypothetical protein